MRENICPQCGNELDCDEVDIGVGVMKGNWRCPKCGWTPEDELKNIMKDQKGK
jgi:hypothetical protein